jgi:catechol 2,3-dioxygenase-like lactoylglutathione lyase family enzyme
MKLELTHIRLLVANFKACFLFYRDVLGLETHFDDPDDVYADFKVGDVQLALFKRALMAEAVGTAGRPSDGEGQDRVALILAVDDVDGLTGS